MRVEESRISKANVCPYKGSEIPRSEELGLDPNKIYHLYRDPDELQKAARTFEGKPLLIRHCPIDAEDAHKDLWVGTIGKVTYEHPYLIARPLVVLTKEAIDLIESEEQRELSSAYRYDALMVPGVFDGQKYDGRMVNIRGNHVAIVPEGRAGPDVHVADELPKVIKQMRNATLIEKLRGFIKPGADVFALDEILGQVPAKSVMTLSKDEKKAAEDEAVAEKREREGEDAELTDEEREEAYQRARDKKAKAKDAAMDAKKARDKADEDDDDEEERDEEEAAQDAKEEDDDERDEGEDAERDEKSADAARRARDSRRRARDRRAGARDARKAARDARRGARDEERKKAGEDRRPAKDATHRMIGKVKGKDARGKFGGQDDHRKDFDPKAVDAMRDDIKRELTKQFHELDVARQAVRPVVGQVSMALDSAEDVYKFALDHLGINVQGVTPSAYAALFEVHQNASRRSSAPAHAMDSSNVVDFDTEFFGSKRRA